jgi:hypothetical protein
MTAPMTLEELVDREAIRDCLARYCRGVDRLDRDLMASTYWPGAEDDHGPLFRGTAEDFIERAVSRAGLMEQTQHVLGQSIFRFEGTTARVETYATAYHRVRRKDRDPYDLYVGARLFDHFEKRGDEWRVARRKLVQDWFREFPDSADWSKGFFGGPWPMGSRNAEDPSYEFWR